MIKLFAFGQENRNMMFNKWSFDIVPEKLNLGKKKKKIFSAIGFKLHLLNIKIDVYFHYQMQTILSSLFILSISSLVQFEVSS